MKFNLLILDDSQKLLLTELAQGLPAITPSFGAVLAEACAVCLEKQNHSGWCRCTTVEK